MAWSESPLHNQKLMEEFGRIAGPGSQVNEVLQHISDRLHNELVRYNWAGFYLADPADPIYLLLGPHSSVFTPRIRIWLNQGLCGAAASMRKTLAVNDVSKDSQYLKGVDATKSEIIVSILVQGTVVAEFDVNRFFKDPWTAEETRFGEQCAAFVKQCM